MKGKDWAKLLGVAGAVVSVIRFLNPACPWCGVALDTIAIGERAVCPKCRRTVTALQALLGRLATA